MFTPREMRRKDRKMTPEKARELLEAGEFGVLATANEEGLPLATPLNYVVLNDTLYFHCAIKGHKLDNITAQPRVCFCVVGKNNAVFTETGHFTTWFESAMVHGAASIVQDDDEKSAALYALCNKYLPQHIEKAGGNIKSSLSHLHIVAISMEEISGKSNWPG